MNGASHANFNPPSDANSVLPRGVRRVLANLAFGGLNLRSCEALTAEGLDPGRHLAYLPTDALELDLADESRRQFGDYELLELIGEGGMGVVYRARQISLDREVAVKLLSAGPWASRDFVERFQREAQNAARMQHPNIVTIHEVGTVEELHFFSMRLIRGPSLAAAVKSGGKLPGLRAARLLRTIAEALDYAHRLGVLHLDLKPANVLLDETGEPHVADFGLARRLDQARVTNTREISGTPSYMAPEQARGETLTAATDIWGMGAILYELATGQPLFRGETPQATLKLVLASPVPAPRGLARSVPPDLEAVVLKCLRKDPAERYPSARALADDLSRLIEGRPVRARPLKFFRRVGRQARREPKIAALSILVLAALSAGFVATTQQWRRAQTNASAAQANAMLANERLWQARLDQADSALRDGHSYDALPLLAANIAEREARSLDAREDRIRFALAERGAPRLIDTITLGQSISGIGVSPDGASVAVATVDEKLRLFDVATGEQRWETAFAGSTHFLPAIYQRPIHLAVLRFSPDGKRLIGRDRVGVDWPIPTGQDEVLFDAATGKVLVPPRESVPDFRDATYSADGAYALVFTNDQSAVLMRTADWEMLGTPQPLAGDRVRILTNGGRYLATSARDDGAFGALNVYDARSFKLLHRFEYPHAQRMTAWAAGPDGESLVIGHFDGRVDLITLASGRSRDVQPRPLGRIGWVTFSPDGRWFGAASYAGDVIVWGSANSRPAALPMHLNVEPSTNHREQLQIDARTHTVLASCDMEMALWHVPNDVTPPVRLSGEFPNIDAFWFRGFDYNAPRGLIATDGGGAGELHLWRVPLLPELGRRGAPLPAPQLHIADGRLAAVDGNRVTIIDARDGRVLGPPLDLEQMPTFADLTADGRNLILTLGPSLRVYDAATLSPAREPIALPNDPARVVPGPDSRRVLLLFADYDNGRNRELAQNWDLATGQPTSAPMAVEYADELRFRSDGKAIAWWSGSRVRVIDAITLAPTSAWFDAGKQAVAVRPGLGLAADAGTEITEAKFSADGSRLDVLSVSGDSESTILWHIDAATGNVIGHTLLGTAAAGTVGAEEFVAITDHGAFIAQRPGAGPIWVDAARGSRQLPGLGVEEFRALALAPDSALFARANANAIVLASALSLRAIGTPLPTALARADDYRTEHPIQIAFADEGNTLVSRSRRGRWLSWNIAPDPRPSQQLLREANWLGHSDVGADEAKRPALTLAERAQLRAADPGTRAAVAEPGNRLPTSRLAHPADVLVDLSAIANDDIDEAFAPGLHRFLGVDYDARGSVWLSPGSNVVINAGRQTDYAGVPRRVEGILPARHRASAVQALVAFPGSLMNAANNEHATIEIAYHDGSSARLPIVYTTAMNDIGHGGTGGGPGSNAPRIAWRAVLDGTPRVYRAGSKMFAVRLDNPHPDRDIDSLAIEATGTDGIGPVFFAITLEP